MIEDIRKTALAHAMELAKRYSDMEASDIVKDASIFETYLTGGAAGSAPVNDAAGSIEPTLNLIARDCPVLNGQCGDVFPFGVGQSRSHDMDQALTGCNIPNCTHKNTSSQKENNCGPELPTPGSTETVIPGGGTVIEQGTHGRTDEGE